MSALGSYYPAGVNEYVPNMQYAADVDINGHIPIDLSPLVAMLAASATGILNAQSIAAAVDTTTFVTAFANNQNVSEAYMGRFGRGFPRKSVSRPSHHYNRANHSKNHCHFSPL